MKFIQKIGDIDSIQDCQWFCNYVYEDRCTWFMHNEKTRECKLFGGQLNDIFDDCNEKGFPAFPSFSECTSAFNPSSENGCYVMYISKISHNVFTL